jgi:hypothetical protein
MIPCFRQVNCTEILDMYPTLYTMYLLSLTYTHYVRTRLPTTGTHSTFSHRMRCLDSQVRRLYFEDRYLIIQGEPRTVQSAYGKKDWYPLVPLEPVILGYLRCAEEDGWYGEVRRWYPPRDYISMETKKNPSLRSIGWCYWDWTCKARNPLKFERISDYGVHWGTPELLMPDIHWFERGQVNPPEVWTKAESGLPQSWAELRTFPVISVVQLPDARIKLSISQNLPPSAAYTTPTVPTESIAKKLIPKTSARMTSSRMIRESAIFCIL